VATYITAIAANSSQNKSHSVVTGAPCAGANATCTTPRADTTVGVCTDSIGSLLPSGSDCSAEGTHCAHVLPQQKVHTNIDIAMFFDAYTACLICCPVLAADLLQSGCDFTLCQYAHNMLHGTSMLTTCCIAVCNLLHCWLMITSVVAGTYCVPGTTCMACAPGTTCSGASTAPCTQTASGSGTCSCSASPVPESTVCVPWGRLLPCCGTLYTLRHSILPRVTDHCRKTCLFWSVCVTCMAQLYRPEWLQRKLKHCF